MKPHSISLTIDNPCTQNWDGMIVNDNGKFCTSCNKNVIDFSSLSDAEIIKLLSNTTSNVCGRLNSQQLNRVIHPKAETQNGLSKFWLSFSLTALLSNLGIVKATAQTTTKTEQLPTNNVSAKHPLSVDNLAVTKIKIILIDSLTNEPIPFADILIKELDIKGQTNFEGVFEFIKPTNSTNKNIDMKINCLGYKSTTCSIDLNKTGTSKNNIFYINMLEQAIELRPVGMLVIYKPTLWQRIKYKFSRK